MNRSISLSEHHARRRKAHAAREKEGRHLPRGSTSIHSSSTEDDYDNEGEGDEATHDAYYGIAHDAASFGAYDAPLPAPRRARSIADGGGVRSAIATTSGRDVSSDLFDGEHASYTAERCIGYYYEGGGDTADGLVSRTMRPSNATCSSAHSPQRGIVSPPPTCFSSPEMDMEGQCARYYHVSRRGVHDDTAVRNDRYPNRSSSVGGGSISSSVAGGRSSVGSCTSSETFVSVNVVEGEDVCSIQSFEKTPVGGTGRMTPQEEEEDAIRAGIVDISVFVATYLAGGLSFVVGIFLALLSPFIKLIKIIFGDLTGLIGDAFGLALRNNPGLCRDLEGLTRIFKSFSSRSTRASWYGSRHRRRGSDENVFSGPEVDCEASCGGESQYTYDSQYSSSYWDGRSAMGSEGDSSYATHLSQETSPQYVGGWSPSINVSSSRGSNSQQRPGSNNVMYHHSSPLQNRQGMPSVGRHMQATRGGMGTNNNMGIMHNSTAPTPSSTRSRVSSKSYSSLPQVNEDDVSSCPPSVFSSTSSTHYYPELEDASIVTSLSASSYNRERESRRRLMQRPRVLSRGSTRRGSGHFL
ncbi:hypothetical protein HJC23_013765 [Cyclotella cryptica]|uniref:Uncharacterized protein n=1 Tax=Cyclotella cryptica TaxID=29204 RepID=A0ABD3NT95_9STRA|eukprot:CCRYP_019730-RA/>CCRYP_019730-RA protein AED:0.02 eAED:0.02 QI:497/1/1/1/1/1/2/1143/580